MKKILIITVVLAISALMLVACSQPAVQPEDTTPPVENIEQDANTEPSEEPTGGAAKIAGSAEDAQGTFVGRIDNNSVEIQMTPVDTLAFRVTDVLDQLEDIKDGDQVKFSYESNEYGQMVITKIEKLQ
jgi:hypothetical protein